MQRLHLLQRDEPTVRLAPRVVTFDHKEVAALLLNELLVRREIVEKEKVERPPHRLREAAEHAVDRLRVLVCHQFLGAQHAGVRDLQRVAARGGELALHEDARVRMIGGPLFLRRA